MQRVFVFEIFIDWHLDETIMLIMYSIHNFILIKIARFCGIQHYLSGIKAQFNYKHYFCRVTVVIGAIDCVQKRWKGYKNTPDTVKSSTLHKSTYPSSNVGSKSS